MILFALMAVLTANAADFYLIGGFNNWTVADESCKFSATSTDGVYELKYNGTLTSGFKLNDGSWSGSYNIGSNGSTLEIGKAYTYYNGSDSGNINMSESVANPTITLDINAGTLLVEGSAAETTISYDINGSFEDGTNWTKTLMTDAGNGIWTVTIEVKKDAAFGIDELANGNWSAWWAASTSGVSVSDDTEITLVNSNTSNIAIATGTYDFSLDTSNMVLTIKKQGSTGITTIALGNAADSTVFNLAGQRVNKSAKGLVIVGGKKILNK